MNAQDLQRVVEAKLVKVAGSIGADIARELKIVLSVPAPRVPGSKPPRAATKAIPGAPPRKLSGRGRAAVSYRVERTNDGVTVWVGNNVVYMGHWEYNGHPWLRKTIERMMPSILAKFNRAMGTG